MKYPIPPWLMPVNIFEIAGSFCCLNLYKIYTNNILVRNYYCYNARTIFEANTCVIWGSVSSKLATHIASYISYLPERHFIMHISGCDNVAKIATVSVHKQINKCSLSKPDVDQIFKEARQCLTR